MQINVRLLCHSHEKNRRAGIPPNSQKIGEHIEDVVTHHRR